MGIEGNKETIDLLLSIVTPVYNTNMEFLSRCVSSVLHSKGNFEWIVVDDGSDKPTADYLDQLPIQDKRVRIVHTQNFGVSSARNRGIGESHGKYITFLDSDDSIDIDTVLDTLDSLKDHSYDALYGLICVNMNGNDTVREYRSGVKIQLIGSQEIRDFRRVTLVGRCLPIHSFDSSGLAPYYLHGKVFKRDIVKNISFHNGISLGEDSLFLLEVSYKVHSVALINEVWYSYYVHNESLSQPKSIGFALDQLNGYDIYAEIATSLGCSSSDIALRIAISYRKIYSIVGTNISVSRFRDFIKQSYLNRCTELFRCISFNQYRLKRSTIPAFLLMSRKDTILLPIIIKVFLRLFESERAM